MMVFQVINHRQFPVPTEVLSLTTTKTCTLLTLSHLLAEHHSISHTSKQPIKNNLAVAASNQITVGVVDIQMDCPCPGVVVVVVVIDKE